MTTRETTSEKPAKGAAPKTSGTGKGHEPSEAAADRTGLDAMLTDAAVGPGRMRPGLETLQVMAQLARRPQLPVRTSLALTKDLAQIAVGRSEVAPDKKDKRFADPAWTDNPLYSRACKSYLATSAALEELVAQLDLDWKTRKRARFLLDNLIDAASPSNSPLNPMALKVALDTGGKSLVRGVRNAAHDLSRRPHIPAMVDTEPFNVGENIAVTQGAVVLRTPTIELIQYRPRTEKVHATPLLLVPPMINKFYVADLAPDRSMVQHFLDSGQPVFVISWRNPGAEQRDWTFDTYVQAVLDALEATRQISESGSAHVLGLCAGGITASSTLAYLAANGRQEEVASLTLGVTVLDQHHAGTVGSFIDESNAQAAIAQSQRQGYLDGRSLAGVFAWLRPNDLIWNYWVNNYLLGKRPPAFDVLFWNNDVTRMAAGLHRDFIQMAVHNTLVTPGETIVLGTPIDLSAITVDSYVVAGIADHITPWHNCYRTVNLLGSQPRFVLSTNGHIAALVNPPGNAKSSYRINDKLPKDPDAWLEGASSHPGSWWDDWTAWVAARSGGEKDAPAELGSEQYPAGVPAPGEYVFET